jgi:hypothetical protein
MGPTTLVMARHVRRRVTLPRLAGAVARAAPLAAEAASVVLSAAVMMEATTLATTFTFLVSRTAWIRVIWRLPLLKSEGFKRRR